MGDKPGKGEKPNKIKALRKKRGGEGERERKGGRGGGRRWEEVEEVGGGEGR